MRARPRAAPSRYQAVADALTRGDSHPSRGHLSRPWFSRTRLSAAPIPLEFCLGVRDAAPQHLVAPGVQRGQEIVRGCLHERDERRDGRAIRRESGLFDRHSQNGQLDRRHFSCRALDRVRQARHNRPVVVCCSTELNDVRREIAIDQCEDLLDFGEAEFEKGC